LPIKPMAYSTTVLEIWYPKRVVLRRSFLLDFQ
jgi:hypothetical protein